MPSFSTLRPAFNDEIQSFLCYLRDLIAKSTILQVSKICARKIDYLLRHNKHHLLGTPFLGQNIKYHPKYELEQLAY